MVFANDEHETFYYEKLDQARYQDCYHKVLIYTLGISEDIRNYFSQIYDIKSRYVKPGMQRQSKIAFHQGWQTSGSVRVVRLAFNLYTDGTPSVDDYEGRDKQIHHGNKDSSVHRTWKSKGQLTSIFHYAKSPISFIAKAGRGGNLYGRSSRQYSCAAALSPPWL